MLRKLFILAMCFLILACSNDDDNSPQEYNIKKYSSISVDADGNPTGGWSEYLFDESGKITQKTTFDSQFNDTRVVTYTNNELGQILENRMDFVEQNSFRLLHYIYDSENRLTTVFREGSDGDIDDLYELTYEPNKIRIDMVNAVSAKDLIYANGILTSINWYGDGFGYSIENILYDANKNIIDQTKTHTHNTEYYQNYIYNYDSNINPLYKAFQEYPLNLLDDYGFNLSLYSLFFSPNNYIKRTMVQNDDTATRLIDFQYNAAGYPTNNNTTDNGSNGEFYAQATYEYY